MTWWQNVYMSRCNVDQFVNWSGPWEAFWIPVAKVPSLASGRIQQLELTRCPGTDFLDFESTRTGLRLHLFILSASITSIVEHFEKKERPETVITRWSGGDQVSFLEVIGRWSEVIRGDQRYEYPFFAWQVQHFSFLKNLKKWGSRPLV